MSLDLDKSVTAAKALPPRQRQVLVCLGRGMLVKETAVHLKIAEKTVSATRTVIYTKLGVSNVAEATRVACAAFLV